LFEQEFAHRKKMLTYYVVRILLAKLSLSFKRSDGFYNVDHMYCNVKFYTAIMLAAQALAFALFIWLPSQALAKIFGEPKLMKAKARVPFSDKKKDEDGFFDYLFRSAGAIGGAKTSGVAIGLTLGLNLLMWAMRFFWALNVLAGASGSSSFGESQRAMYREQFYTIANIHVRMNQFGDSLLYLGVLIVWISLVVSGEMCGKAKRAEEDSAAAGDVEEGKKEGECANFGAQNQAHPCGGYGANQTASYPCPAAVPTTYPYNAAVSQPAYPAVCQPAVTAPYYK
jgi:hypothetical protein